MKRRAKKAAAKKTRTTKVAKKRRPAKRGKARVRARKAQSAKNARTRATGLESTTGRANRSARRVGGSPRVSARPAVAEAAAGAGLKRLIPLVSTELTRRGLNRPDPEVVRTIAAVSAGYRTGPASDPPFPTAGDIDKPVVRSWPCA